MHLLSRILTRLAHIATSLEEEYVTTTTTSGIRTSTTFPVTETVVITEYSVTRCNIPPACMCNYVEY